MKLEYNINMKSVIAASYKDVFKDVMRHGHTHYVFPGGRGSLKSSTVSVLIPLIMINNPTVHAICFRKVANTIQTSIFPQIVWAIYQLGLEDLFTIPKTYSTPIVFKPTGQRILFMGMDDPMKVKSIKLPFGYIGITWFEELDQYAGENELRTVTQSTMRGGEKFWDFRTFNPPISRNNWANEYADSAETRDNTSVFRTTYLDVPREWLGEQFIEEAEDLKEVNPRAYEHEYMGVPTGTGGDVFPNVQELDMEQIIEYKDSKGVLIDSVPMWKSFDRVYNGIDWGFAIDPTRFVKCHFDRTHLDLYIFDEYTTYHSRSQDIFDELYEEQKKIKKEDLLTADPGPGGLFLIADFKAFGAYVRPAIKGPESVRYGIKWLQGLRHIYIDKHRCPETFKEFVNYEYEQDKDGNFISAYPDENNHSIDAIRYALNRYCIKKGN